MTSVAIPYLKNSLPSQKAALLDKPDGWALHFPTLSLLHFRVRFSTVILYSSSSPMGLLQVTLVISIWCYQLLPLSVSLGPSPSGGCQTHIWGMLVPVSMIWPMPHFCCRKKPGRTGPLHMPAPHANWNPTPDLYSLLPFSPTVMPTSLSLTASCSRPPSLCPQPVSKMAAPPGSSFEPVSYPIHFHYLN